MFKCDVHIITDMMLQKYEAHKSEVSKLLNDNLLVMYVTADATYLSIFSDGYLITYSICGYIYGIEYIKNYIQHMYSSGKVNLISKPDLSEYISKTLYSYLNNFSSFGLSDLVVNNLLLVVDDDIFDSYIVRTLNSKTNFKISTL